MAFHSRGRIKSRRPRGKEPSCSASNTEESQTSEKTLRNTDNDYLDGASIITSSMFHASATNAIPSAPGIQMGQGNPERTTGRSRKRRGRGGKVKGPDRGDTTMTTYAKGQNATLATLQQKAFGKSIS